MQVTRRRRRPEKAGHGLLGFRTGHRRRTVIAGSAVAVLVASGTGISLASTQAFDTAQVGQDTKDGKVVSDDQFIDPIGDRIQINDGKIMGSAVSPDHTHVVSSVTDSGKLLTVVDLKTGKVQQSIAAASGQANNDGQAAPVYSPDGKQLWLGQLDGYSKYTVNADGSLSDPVKVAIPADGSKHALASAAVFSKDGSTVYSAVNGQNKVVAIDTATGDIKHSWTAGTAPRDMVEAGGKLYVSNEGGRPAKPGEQTMNSYGTDVPADPNTGSSTTGTVSVIDPATPDAAPKTINVGLHPTALHAAKGALFVTNTGSDNVSVIDTASNSVVQTIATQPWPESKVGYAPDGVTLTDDGHLLVTLGRANAVAVYRYKGPKDPVSYVGLLPTDYYPAAVNTVDGKVVVSNRRGIDARRPTSKGGFGTHDTTSSLTQFTLPSDRDIKADTGKVFRQNGWHGAANVQAGHSHAKPVPVPVHLGDPSTIKHVFMIVKENRTYDQQFGDMSEGNGDKSLTEFGEKVTPNQHALARQFGLYDNTYDAGTNSAEGHNWLMQADNPEYTESTAGQYERSYDTEDDVLGHQRSGFIWSGAQAAGKSVKDFGEFQTLEQKPAGATWQDFYCDGKNMDSTGKPSQYPIKTGSAIPSLNKVSVQGFPKFDTDIPDVYKASVFKQDFEKNGPANLNMFWLSDDHTGGGKETPDPASQVADNDLATGKIVDEISHSKYWKDSAIFVMEDDSQAGMDHVDGHRAPVQIISPWARHGVVDSHYYSQITMLRTIEQILGIKPMNQKDSAATPMSRAFTKAPDTTPFKAVPNKTSLTAGLGTPPACGEDTAKAQSNAVPADEKRVAAKWSQWETHQHLTGPNAVPDYANPEQMDHLTWYETHGWKKPFPGEHKIFAPADLPGASIPPSENDG